MNIDGMTDEQKRVKIAEACGWRHVSTTNQPHLTYWELGIIGVEGYKRTDWCGNVAELLPDYLNDLNAMHEAEKVLTEDQHDKFRTILQRRTNPKPEAYLDRYYDYREYVSATASQRADTFLLTLP